MIGPNLNYQTSIGIRDAIGGGTKQSLLAGLTANTSAGKGDSTAARAASQMGRQVGATNAANMGHEIAGANADLGMAQMARRSETAVSGLNDEAQRYADVLERGAQQRSLATDVQLGNLGFATGLATNQIRALQRMRDEMSNAAGDWGDV